MALQLPGYTALPVSRSSLEGLLEQFDEGRRLRADENAFDAAASAFGGKSGSAGPIVQPPTALERLAGFAGTSKPLPANGALPPNTMQMAPPDMVGQSHSAVASASDPALTDYFANARATESGGNDAAKNPNSTATGRYQFLDSTWRGLMDQYPELGLTAEGRTDGAQQERAMAKFTQDNARTLAGAGLPVNPGTLYAAHFLGAGGASNVLGQDPASPLSAYLQPGVLEANPNLNGMTVGDFAAWANEKGGGGSGGGYRPPMRNEGQVPGARQFAPDPDTLRTLLASEATRPLAMELITAQQNADASEGRFVVEQGSDGAIWQRDTLTGEQSILRDAPAAAKPIEVGGVLLDPQTLQPIFDSRTTGTPEMPADVQEYQFYAEQERAAGREPLSIIDYNQALKGNGLTVTTNADGTTTVQQGGAPKPLTEGQSKDTVYATRAANALPTIDELENTLLSLPDNMAGGVPIIGNYLQSEDYQVARDAGLEYLASILRKDTGAAVTPSEEALYGRIFLPQPGDKEATVQMKRQRRALAVEAIKAGMPAQALENMARALDTAGSTAAPPAPSAGPVTITDDAGYDALPSGSRFVGPDGVEREKP